MGTDVIMPALGMAQETGKLLRWLKHSGDTVQKGEVIAEIETDKATVELEAPGAGILVDVSIAEGQEVPVGRVIARIAVDAAEAARPSPEIASPQAPSPAAASPGPPAPAALPPAAARVPAGAPTAAGVAAPPASSGRVPASPKARRLAKERGVSLGAVKGSGPAGAVLADDVLAAGAAPTLAAGTAPTLSTVWRLMAERTTQAWTTVPHFFLLREVHASRLIAWREKSQKRISAEITYTDLLVKLASAALRGHARLNARWEGGRVVDNDAINIGLAVATDDGLVVPVIHGAERLSLAAIVARRREVVERAQAGRLRPDDISGGTFTISNLGMYGVDAFNAIINAPQAAILAVGRIAQRVVPVDGRPEVRPVMILSLSCDHRVVDGARGAQFLDSLADLIEEPASLVE